MKGGIKLPSKVISKIADDEALTSWPSVAAQVDCPDEIGVSPETWPKVRYGRAADIRLDSGVAVMKNTRM